MLAATINAPAPVLLPALREDLQLQSAPRGLDGAPYWNLYDPVRNRFFRIGWLEFEILSRWRHKIEATQLAQQIGRECVLQASEEDVLSLLSFLHTNQLLQAAAPNQRQALYEYAQKQKPNLWQWFLHNYLFFRVPLFKPEALLNATVKHLGFLFRPGFYVLAAALAVLGVWRVLDQWSAFSSTFLYFFSWEGALWYGLALVLTKTLHEFGHAYTAKHYGLRVPTMGVAFMMLWPLLYTDTSEGWKLQARRARLAIGGAGIIAELLLAGWAALAWSLLPEGPLKSAAYVLAAVTWISTLAINLNPFMRFDGYYLLMDALDMPNLHERCFACARWHLRRLLLGVEQPFPEPELEHKQRALILFAYTVWIYRLILFTGIAVAVYYFFFKVAGVILFAVEIGWFVVRPIYKEMQVWQQLRSLWRRRRVALSLSLFAGLILLLALPWRSQISADGFAQANLHTRLYAPLAAQVLQVHVREGQQVEAGTLLISLQAPEVTAQMAAVEERRSGLQAQLERAVSHSGLLERMPLLQKELTASETMLQALQEEQEKLQIRAPHAGVVRDLEPGLYPSAWVSTRRMLARVLAPGQTQAQVWVRETEVGRIHNGANATLLLRRADTRRLQATVESIDTTPTRVLPQALLASSYGGPLAARNGSHGEPLANEALFRVTLKLAPGQEMPSHLFALVAQIDADHSSPLAQFGRYVGGVLIRESGF